jgi:hypothetical protein
MMITCSRYWLADFMRDPCIMAHARAVAGWAVAVTTAMATSKAHAQTSRVTMTQETGSRSSVSVTSTVTQGAGSSIRVHGSGSDIRIINGRVWIDGETVPEDATRWTTRDGRIFRIHRQGNQVHVVSE